MGPGHRDDRSELSGAVDVLVDRSGRIGPLSYLLPTGVAARPGDAVHVPFGKREADGVVLGPGDPSRATREVLAVHGPRVTAGELQVARDVAGSQLCELRTLAPRLAPRDGKGAPAFDAGPVELVTHERPRGLAQVPDERRRRLLVCAPLVDQTLVAAVEAARCATDGQVLVLCPTTDAVARTMAHLASGAVRLDAAGRPGSWKSFASGTAAVGVGTRAACLYSAPELAAVVVVDENHPGHRERAQPYTHARDVAVARADAAGAQLVLVSSAPSVRALAAKVKTFPVGGVRDWPEVHVVDVSAEDPAERLPGAVRRAMGRRPAVVVVDDAPVHVCARCRALVGDGPCGTCGDEGRRQVNWDAERARSVLPHADHTTVDALVEGEGRTVLVPQFDSVLRRPGLAPEAWPMHVFTRAARAAGPRGAVVLVVRDTSHPLLEDLRRRDLVAQARRTWESGRTEGLPPFEVWMRVRCGTARPPSTSGWPGRVLGPRRVGEEWEVVVQVPHDQRHLLERLAERLRRRGRTRIQVL